MVIAFQKSCFVGPINPADGLRKHFPQRKTPKKRLVRQREHQMRTVVRETRIWALASALPMTTYFAEVGLTTETEFLGKRIFGPHITERKIRGAYEMAREAIWEKKAITYCSGLRQDRSGLARRGQREDYKGADPGPGQAQRAYRSRD